jgi:hypothetical protein
MPLKTICLPAGTEHVQFGELAHLIANALHPLSDGATDSEMMAYGGARINLEAELEQAVEADTLPVKDPLTLGPHTFPVGDALRRARVMVADLRAFLADRPVTVEIAPAMNSASEPGFYTLEEAAQAIATNLGWHDGARDTLKNQLMDAARDGLLTVRHPHTVVPYRPVTVREFNELVTPPDVNEWAARVGVSWRWELPTPEPKAAPVITFASFGKSAFMQLIRHEEKRLMAHEARADGVYVRAPDASEIRLGLTEPQAIHPTGDYDAPALPFPFTLAQFLAFEKTAGIVGQMHDDEIDALKDKAPMPYQLAMAARYVEAGGNVNDLMQAPEPQAAPEQTAAPVADDWKAKACDRAVEIIERQRVKDLYPSQQNIADEIAREFRRDGVMGADGKPLSGAYIKRHALKGISSAQNKLRSTSIHRGN